jgi:hypothetical protein
MEEAGDGGRCWKGSMETEMLKAGEDPERLETVGAELKAKAFVP